MSRCHVCERPREPEDEDAGYLVALRNHLYFPACLRCWFMWPDEHKIPSKANPDLELGGFELLGDTIRVLRETA